jgi:hypothetical protein
MDITNNISAIEKPQNGGDINDDEIINISTSSSDFDVNISETIDSSKKTTVKSSEKLLEELIGGSDEETLKKVNIDSLIKNPAFNKLSNNEKSLVINKINEETNKELGQISKSTDTVVSKECYFYCKTCGYYEIIPDKMFIFSRGDEKKDDIYNFNFINNKNDPTLPNTQKYTCINDKCSTHKEPQLKNAVFYRQKGSYTTRYICTICDAFWNTFIEK